VVWSTPKTRGSLSDIHDLRIDTPFDVPVRLGDVAQARLVPRPSRILHEDVSRFVDIAVQVEGRSAHAVREDIQSRLRQFQFPLEFHAKIFGAYEQWQADRNRLLAFAAIALMGILLLLQAAYESWRLALLTFTTSCLALVGGLAALATVEPQDLSLGPVFGLLAVFGMTARNQIALLRRFRALEGVPGKSTGWERILQGTREHFACILMTSLILGLALLPLLFLGDVPGLEVLRPTVRVILGGIVTGALLDLFVVPILFLRLSRAGVPVKV